MSLAILCPGQGNQHARMFENLLGEDKARPVLAKIAALTQLDLGNLEAAQDSGLLARNHIAQILVVGHSLALRALLDFPDHGLVIAGYSVGDLTAHAISGALSVDDALALADARGRAMDEAAQASEAPLSMAGIRGVSETQLTSLLGEDVKIALVNGRDHFVIGGPVSALDAVEHRVLKIGAHIKRLGVTVASHTPCMKNAAAEFRAALLKHEWRRPQHRLLSPIDGGAVMTKDQAIDGLSRQIEQRLDWASAMQSLVEYGVTATLELGAGKALSAMMAEAHPAITARAVDDFKTVAGLSQWIARHC